MDLEKRREEVLARRALREAAQRAGTWRGVATTAVTHHLVDHMATK